VSKRKSVDDRLTARIWAATIHLAMLKGIRTSFRSFDLDLAFMLHEANIMRAMLLIACKQANIDVDELRACVQETYDLKLTKVARKSFDMARHRLVIANRETP
jgi:hypothetical protein